MDNDVLSILSFNSSRKGLQTLSPHIRSGYLHRIFQCPDTKPDICFLPGDDEAAKLNAIRGYGQYTLQQCEGTVFLYDVNRVQMSRPNVSLNSIGSLPGLDLDKLVVPHVKVFSLQPHQRVVKEFSMVSWKYDLFQSATVPAETLMESILIFSQRLINKTEKPIFIGGEMNIEFDTLMEIVKKISKDREMTFLKSLKPDADEQCYTPSMLKGSTTDIRHRFMMKVYRCKSNSSNDNIQAQDYRQKSDVIIPDCFIASKHLELKDASLLDIEKVPGRQISMPLLQKHKPTQTSMEIPVRPPKHHGG
ncbi:uncharacterized protein LOC132727863 [Ruditapes philippinarum]|uniref:uncharacterized protein LOC132727863 n=1 Tax=Ruditapes philippinarum TaxID=129788 RepID=UPI00295B24CF|nr:uncharacterized protein LOC132727863 [Ruditapes philippinarum]